MTDPYSNGFFGNVYLSAFSFVIFYYSCKNLVWKGLVAATPVIEMKLAPYSIPVRWEIWESTDEVKIQTVPGPEQGSECGGLQVYVLAVQQSLALLSSLPVPSVRSTDRTEFLNRTNCAAAATVWYGARRSQRGDLDQPWGTGGNIGGSGLYSTPAGSPADRPVGWVAGCAETAESVTFVCSLNGASLAPYSLPESRLPSTKLP